MIELPPSVINATNALKGQLMAIEDLDVLVKDVHLVQEAKYDNKLVKTRGVFLVIDFEVANLGKYFINSFGAMMQLLDEKNTEIRGFLDFPNAIWALSAMGYGSSSNPAPGFVGLISLYYDLPLTISSLRLAMQPDYKQSNRKPSLESFKFSGGKGPDSGAGQELVGKTCVDKEGVKATIYKIERLTQINKGDEIIYPEGVFLAVAYELENGSKQPVNWPRFGIRDNTGRFFETTRNPEAFVALAQNYKRDMTVYPGQTGFGYQVYELVKEAKELELV